MRFHFSSMSMLCCFLFSSLSVVSQPILTLSDQQGTPGDTVVVDIRVDNFMSISSFQFSVNWDPEVISFIALEEYNDSLQAFGEDNFNFASDLTDIGQLVVSWSDPLTRGIHLPDSATLFALVFTAIGDIGDSTTIVISDDPLEIEVIDGDLNSIGLSFQGGLFAVAEMTTSFREFGNHELSIFPNPTFGEFRIQNDHSFSTVEVFNVRGHRLPVARMNNGYFDLSNYPCGTYFAVLKSSNQIKAAKLCKY